MQKYGILYYNMNTDSGIFSLSLLNVNIFKKQTKQNLGDSKISSVGKAVYHLTQV